MKPFWIVEGLDVVKEQGLSLERVFWDLMVEAFALKGSKEALHGSVIIAVGMPLLTHSRRSAMRYCQKMFSVFSSGFFTDLLT